LRIREQAVEIFSGMCICPIRRNISCFAVRTIGQGQFPNKIFMVRSLIHVVTLDCCTWLLWATIICLDFSLGACTNSSLLCLGTLTPPNMYLYWIMFSGSLPIISIDSVSLKQKKNRKFRQSLINSPSKIKKTVVVRDRNLRSGGTQLKNV